MFIRICVILYAKNERPCPLALPCIRISSPPPCLPRECHFTVTTYESQPSSPPVSAAASCIPYSYSIPRDASPCSPPPRLPHCWNTAGRLPAGLTRRSGEPRPRTDSRARPHLPSDPEQPRATTPPPLHDMTLPFLPPRCRCPLPP